MSSEIVKLKHQCIECEGWGLVRRGQIKAVCGTCKGSGSVVYLYHAFDKRKTKRGEKRNVAYLTHHEVDQHPELLISADEFYASDDPFTRDQKVQRPFYCPAEAIQNILGRNISDKVVERLPCKFSVEFKKCSNYSHKHMCWATVDAESLLDEDKNEHSKKTSQSRLSMDNRYAG